jgi:acetyl-CoA carboxylase biotin carboxyl carrier protein
MSDFDDIERMVELMDAHGLEEFELEQEGRRVRLRKASRSHVTSVGADEPVSGASVPAPSPIEQPGATDDNDGLVVVKSPIVGTFFEAADPDADPFVNVGSSVRRGQVLCIIEAMKLMNEIDAEVSGEIVSIFVENGQPVQYGEQLFAIKPA